MARTAQGHGLHEQRLSGSRGTDNESALTKADRRKHIDDPRRHIFAVVLHDNPLLRVQRRQGVEVRCTGIFLGRRSVDFVDAQQGEEPFVGFRWSDLTGNDAARAQSELSNLTGRDVNVVRTTQIMVVRAAEESETVGQNFERSPPGEDLSVAHAGRNYLKDEFLARHLLPAFDLKLACQASQLIVAGVLNLGDRKEALHTRRLKFCLAAGEFAGDALRQRNGNGIRVGFTAIRSCRMDARRLRGA